MMNPAPELYEKAMKQLEPHIVVQPDGTFKVQHDGLGIDPIVFSDLVRSVEITNELIRRGEINSDDIVNKVTIGSFNPKLNS